MEFEDAVSERMAQLEHEDLDRYQHDILMNSRNSYADENPSYDDEFQRKLPVLLDMVRGIIDSLKPTTFSSEHGYALPTMDLHPLSFVDDVISCDHSDFGFEPTFELHPVEDLVVNEMPVSADVTDLFAIQGNDSSNSKGVPDLEDYKVSESAINSHSLVNPSHQNQFTSDSGFKVLSIYCAHMATKWRPVLDSQPIQGNDMSVDVYYDNFINWKRKLEEVNYMGGEESYVDDFIHGLEINLGMRVCGYKWKPHTLYGAFRRALIEENMMKNDVGRVLEEIPHSNSIGIQGAMYVLDEKVNVVLDASGPLDAKLQLDLQAESNSSLYNNNGRHAKFPSIAHIVAHGEKYIEVDLNTLIDSELLMKKFSFDPGGCPLQNLKMYKQSNLIELNEGNVVHEGVVFSVIDLQATLGPLGDTTVNGSSNGSTKAWVEGVESIIEVFLGQNAMEKYASIISRGIVFPLISEAPETLVDAVKRVDDQLMFMFEPAISFWHLIGCVLINSVVLWSAKMMFCFDPGGSHSTQMGCDLIEFNGELGYFYAITKVDNEPLRFIESYNDVGKSISPFSMVISPNQMNILTNPRFFQVISGEESSCISCNFHKVRSDQLKSRYWYSISSKIWEIPFEHFSRTTHVGRRLKYIIVMAVGHKFMIPKVSVGCPVVLYPHKLDGEVFYFNVLIRDQIVNNLCVHKAFKLLSYMFIATSLGRIQKNNEELWTWYWTCLTFDREHSNILGQHLTLYTLEDNGVLKRKGIGTRVALRQEEWLDKAFGNRNAYVLIWKKFISAIGIFGTILRMNFDILVILELPVYIATVEYVALMTWSSREPHESFWSNILKGFVWDPGRYLNTSSFITKVVRRGVCKTELGGVLVIVPCVKHSVQWYDFLVCVRSCSPHNIETAQIIKTFLENVGTIMLNDVEFTLQTKQGSSVWWDAIFLDMAMILWLDESSCQIKIGKSHPRLQMSMKKERNTLHALIEDYFITYAAMTKIFVLALFPTSYSSYSLWQYQIKHTWTNVMRFTARPAQKCMDKLMLPFSIILGISKSMLYALLLYHPALASRCLGVYKFNVSAAISKMLYGILVFVFRPP